MTHHEAIKKAAEAIGEYNLASLGKNNWNSEKEAEAAIKAYLEARGLRP